MTDFEKWLGLYGQSRLARKLDTSRQLVNQWSKGQRPSDSKKMEIIQLSNGLLDYNSFFDKEKEAV